MPIGNKLRLALNTQFLLPLTRQWAATFLHLFRLVAAVVRPHQPIPLFLPPVVCPAVFIGRSISALLYLALMQSSTCNWSSGQRIGLVTFRLRFESHCGSFASNLEQVANLLCAQINSASYPHRDGKLVVACGLSLV